MTVENPFAQSDLPDVPLGSHIYILTGTSSSGKAPPDTLDNGNYVRENARVSRAAYPELFNLVGYVSSTGTTSSGVEPIGSNNFIASAYGNSTYIVANSSSIFTSPTGISGTWISRSSGTTSAIGSMAFGNNIFLYGAGSNIVGYSTDNGATWNTTAVGSSGTIGTIIYDGTQFVLLHNSSNVLRTSTDGITWTTRTTAGIASPSNLTYGNGVYVISNQSGGIATSTDLISWTARTSGTTSIIYSLTYGKGTYVYVGAGGLLATSTDAITWTPRNSGTTLAILRVAYGSGWFFYATSQLTATDSTVGVSGDAINWLALPNTYDRTPQTIVVGDDAALIGGGSSATLRRYPVEYNAETLFTAASGSSRTNPVANSISGTSRGALTVYVRARP